MSAGLQRQSTRYRMAGTHEHLRAELEGLELVLEWYRDAGGRTDPERAPSTDASTSSDATVASSSSDATVASTSSDATVASSSSDATVASSSSDATAATATEAGQFHLAVPEAVRTRLTDARERIDREFGTGDRSDAAPTRLSILVDRFDLSPAHRDAFLLALAPDVDADLAAAWRAIEGDIGPPRPSIESVEALFRGPDGERLTASQLVGPASPLRRHDLVTVGETPQPGAPTDRRRIRVTDRVVDYCKGHDGLDPALADVASLERPATTLDDLRLESDVRERVAGIAGEADAGVRYFHGPDGAGKRRAVDALVDDVVLRADLDALLTDGLLSRFRREALLQDSPVHLANATTAVDRTDTADDLTVDSPAADASASERPRIGSTDAVLDRLLPLAAPCYLTGEDQWTPRSGGASGPDVEYELVAFPMPGFEHRRTLWERRADALPEDVDPAILASSFELTHSEIDDAIATARAIAGDDPSRVALLEGCKAQSAGDLEELAERIEPDADWDDVVLPADTDQQLREVAARVRQRGTVFEEWGFEERFARGTGVVALFAGPSGTGKTLAAEVIAADAGMDLYKIDLSSVVSKYIGETEENLERIFEAATRSNGILLFDEADAVFGERAGVSDATDRYANVEVNYLLQRIETYDGVVLLTTNYESHIDDAFQRRIHQTVSFPRPTPAARERIWRGVFPDATPTEDLDLEHLAQLEVTGGNIRNVAQTAAVLAAEDGTSVQMRHVVAAVRREFDKLDKMLDPSVLGPYGDLLQGDAPEADASHPNSASRPACHTPEQTVRLFFDFLDDGARQDARSLYHPRAVADWFSERDLAILQRRSLSLGDDFERAVDRDDRVVVEFTQHLGGESTRLAYELRPEEDRWLLFDLGRAGERP